METYNPGHCSPLGQKNSGSCINRKLLEKIANILNKNPKCNTIDCACKTGLLHQSVCENIKRISSCNSEHCWLSVHDIVNKLKNFLKLKNLKNILNQNFHHLGSQNLING